MINFQDIQFQSYGESQDKDLSVSTQNSGNILRLAGNGWKKIDLPYKITANTILEFDFKSTSQGEIHSIGFDNDNSLSSTQAFKLYGSQAWGIDQFNNYQEAGQWQTYRIPVGQFFTGDVSYLTFGNDHDVSKPDAESLYRNLRVHEVTDPHLINFQDVQFQSYGESQDKDLSVSTQNSGNILRLAGNGWKKIDLPYKITANTILEFDFKSTSQGEIHSIGFDNDNSLSSTQAFKLYGSQAWGIDQFNNYQEAGQWQTYRIPVGQFFTGDVSYLTFGNDHDVSAPDAESQYRNLRVHEVTDPSTSGQVSSGVSRRDVTKWPFAADSIWNTPIGSKAEYVDANISRAKHLAADVDHFYILSGEDSLQPLYANATWGPGRTNGAAFQNIALPIPDDLLIKDATDTQTPNNSAAFLMPDGRTLVQVNALTRDRNGEAIYGKRLPYSTGVAIYEDIYGSGIKGAHGGSGLSSIGGTIRLGELIGNDPIRHALKVNLWGQKYFSYTQGNGGGLGYRWPAIQSDSHSSPETYAGLTPELLNGSLLAIPPHLTPESLGIQTEAGKKLFYAFQNYGAYVADDTGWNAHAITVEKGVTKEFKDHFGFSFNSRDSLFFEDYMQLFSTLHVVNNNALDNIGGGGTPRAPLAPEFGIGSNPALIGDRERNSLMGDDQANRLDGKEGNDLIKAYGGHDFITGGRGHDTLEGGDGNDHLIGDADWDSLSGGNGNDYLDGSFGKDTLNGGDGNDYLSGGSSGDILDGGLGYDTVIESGSQDYFLSNTELYAKHQQFGNHRDTIISIEHFILSGDKQNNTIDASAFTQGSVHLHGGRGHDNLLGSTQNDTLVSSSGKDTLYGGNGNDTFDLTGRSEFLRSSRSNPYKSGEYALIQDFQGNKDKIILTGAAEDYILGASPINSISGTAIYLDTNSNQSLDTDDEILAIAQGSDLGSLSGNSFRYI